jgi:hypothetical protein
MAAVEVYFDYLFGHHQHVSGSSSFWFYFDETRYAIQTGNSELGAQIEAGNDALRRDFQNLQSHIAKEKQTKIDNASITGRRWSRSNVTDVNFSLKRYLEELPPEDHPWPSMSEPGDVFSLETSYELKSFFD